MQCQLLLGDRRVNQLLWHIKDDLDREEVQTLVRGQSRFLFAATLEFFLDWLEILSGDFNDHRFGNIAAGLVLAKENLFAEKVLDGDRIFPVPDGGSPMTNLTQHSLEDFSAKMAPRLRAIEEREPPPKVMPEVLRAWRVEGYAMH